MNGYKALAIGIGLATTAALVVNTAIIHEAGVSQAAAESALLAYAAIVSHVGGFVGFGLLAGYHSANGNWGKAWGCRFITILAAIFTGWQVLTYTTAQVATQDYARQVAEQRDDAQFKAQLANDAKRIDSQNKLASEQLKNIQSLAKGADGRREKRDALEEGRKLIADAGKIDARMPMPQQPAASTLTPAQLRLGTLPAYVSGVLGINQAAMQAMPWLLLAITMMLIEMKGWPETARCWQYGARQAEDAAAAARTPSPSDDPLKPTVLVVEDEPIRKALPPPKGVKRDPKAITVRANPSGQWKSLLDKIDFPPPGARHKGPLRPKDSREHVALRFLTWLGAYNEQGDFTQTEVEELYKEFAAADHREPWGIKIVKSNLEALRGRIASKWTGADGIHWTITPPAADKLTALLEKRGVISGGVSGVVSPGVLRFPPAKKTSGDAA